MIDVHPKDWRSETFTRNTISHFGERCLRRALTWNFSVDWLAIAWLQCVGIYRSDFVQKSPVLLVLLGCNWNAIVGRVPSAFGGNWGSLSCWCNPYSGLVTGRRFSFEKSNRAYWIILIILIHLILLIHIAPLVVISFYSTCFGWKPLRQSRKWRPHIVTRILKDFEIRRTNAWYVCMFRYSHESCGFVAILAIPRLLSGSTCRMSGWTKSNVPPILTPPTSMSCCFEV